MAPKSFASRGHAGHGTPFPRIPKEAMKRLDAAAWIDAADVEIDARLTNGTWVPCQRPARRTLIARRWVHTEKYLSDGSLERKKATLLQRATHNALVSTMWRLLPLQSAWQPFEPLWLLLLWGTITSTLSISHMPSSMATWRRRAT